MSNLLDLSEEYIDIFPLTNLSLVAFPNFLVVGLPLYKNRKLSFEKYSYIKIRSCDLESWYDSLCTALTLFDSQFMTARSKIVFESDFTYELETTRNLSNNMRVEIILNGDKSFERILYFERNEIMYLLNGIAELNFKMLCYPKAANICFEYIVSNFLKYDQPIDEVSKLISMIKPEYLIDCCEKCCLKNKLNEDPFEVFQIVFRHIVNLLITFRIKKSKYVSSNLILRYQSF